MIIPVGPFQHRIFWDSMIWVLPPFTQAPPKSCSWFHFKHMSSWGNRGKTNTLNEFLLEFLPCEVTVDHPHALTELWFHTQSCWRTHDYGFHSALNPLRAVCCGNTRHCCELCKAHKSPGQTLRNLAASALDPLFL